ncbi:hypothetical protein LIER_40587 [Lithospermum erythrorhizon]|uniref:Mitochondrial protein n=1 Tax=Lithospermum erythrorhizon TaxID=34254 RepID=A0AAV3QWP9_LITER
MTVPHEYRSLVGALQYLSIIRPDITYVVNSASQFMHSPTKLHLIAAKRICRRSTSCYRVFFGPNLVSWSSKKQPTVSRSSTEAEYRALASAAIEVTWIQHLLKDLQVYFFAAPQAYCDNIVATYLAHNPMHSRTKHISINYHFAMQIPCT